MPYHVRAITESKTQLIQYNLSREDLEQRVVVPYQQRQEFTLGRESVHPKYIKYIEIVYTLESRKEWLENRQREQENIRRLGGIASTSIATPSTIFREAENVTERFLPNAQKPPVPGNTSGPPPAYGPGSHNYMWPLPGIPVEINTTQRESLAQARRSKNYNEQSNKARILLSLFLSFVLSGVFLWVIHSGVESPLSWVRGHQSAIPVQALSIMLIVSSVFCVFLKKWRGYVFTLVVTILAALFTLPIWSAWTVNK